jgi:hypothetical protein
MDRLGSRSYTAMKLDGRGVRVSHFVKLVVSMVYAAITMEVQAEEC